MFITGCAGYNHSGFREIIYIFTCFLPYRRQGISHPAIPFTLANLSRLCNAGTGLITNIDISLTFIDFFNKYFFFLFFLLK